MRTFCLFLLRPLWSANAEVEHKENQLTTIADKARVASLGGGRSSDAKSNITSSAWPTATELKYST